MKHRSWTEAKVLKNKANNYIRTKETCSVPRPYWKFIERMAWKIKKIPVIHRGLMCENGIWVVREKT